ncbi:TNF receptor-associated factor 6-like [Scylla paramamosain]|uniref:TNF receptor-associated factor 6-like n=1 Tax=Scylla paramamosain TaxID=85552 RepID=UPI003083734D
MACHNSLNDGHLGESVVLPRTQGYDYEFVPTLDPKYECPICLLALRAPLQTACGHRFCKDCIYNSLSESSRRCPIDNTPLKETDLFPDSCAEREVLQLRVRCPNTSLGCSQVLDLMYIEHHTQACSFQPVLCPNECSATVLQKELDHHLDSQCLLRLKLCALCDLPYPFNEEQLHLATCAQVMVSCELCGCVVARGELPTHRSDSCPRVVVGCPYTEHGCSHKTVRADLDAHLSQSTQYHLHLLSSAQKRVTALVWELSRSAGMWGQSPSGLGFSRQPSLRSQLSATSPSPDRQLGEGSCGERGLVFPSSALKLDGTPPSKLHLSFSQLAIVGEGATALEEGKTGEDGKAGLGKDLAGIHHQQEAILKDLCGKTLEVSQGLLQVNISLSNLQARVEEMEGWVAAELGEAARGKYCQGEYVWRLKDFPGTLAELREKPTRVIHSPGFYTSPFGYKFCLRLNLTRGSGKGERGGEEWLSLFIHGMQGENDDFLDWPFSGIITFSLLDCGAGRPKAHITETLHSSPDRQSFSRPQMHRNPKGFGYTEFAPLSKVVEGSGRAEYVHEGTLHIRATVRLQQQHQGSTGKTGCICQHQQKSQKLCSLGLLLRLL